MSYEDDCSMCGAPPNEPHRTIRCPTPGHLRSAFDQEAELAAKWRAHSVILNRVGWRISEALGNISPGTDSVIGDIEVDLETLIAERDTLRRVLASVHAWIASEGWRNADADTKSNPMTNPAPPAPRPQPPQPGPRLPNPGTHDERGTPPPPPPERPESGNHTHREPPPR